MSRATLQRVLAAERTSFKIVRRRVQLDIALERLTAGDAASAVVREIGVTPDHLCVLVREATGLTPRDIIRARHLADIVTRWKRHGPPVAWSRRYREHRRQWRRVDEELQRLLADLGPSHPLADWAKQLLVAADRPDFRTQPYRDLLREERRKEDEQRDEMTRRLTEAARQASAEYGAIDLVALFSETSLQSAGA
jgi:AraC-like DNA-binding protein